MSDVYVVVYEELFQKHLAKKDGSNAYIRQEKLPKLLRKTALACAKAKGELFVNEIEIITEPFSPLAKLHAEQLIRRYGLTATRCENETRQLEYLGSDGGGHYSTDFYRFLHFGRIIVTLATD